MANLKNIKDRITSVKNTQKITKAMKMVAAAKVKKAENAVKASRPFALELYKMYSWVYKKALQANFRKMTTDSDIDNFPELLDIREIKNVGLIIVSSNKGLAGAYSSNIVRYTINMMKKYKNENKNIKVWFVGQKAVPALKNVQQEYNFEIKKTYGTILDNINSSSAYVIAQDLATAYINKEIDEIQIITTRYKNMMSYKTESWQILPTYTYDKNEKVQKFRSKELDIKEEINYQEHKIEPLSEFLPSMTSVLSEIMPMFITNGIYQALLEAQASELASRMTAMSAAVNNASDMINNLTIEYNKARQSIITQELTEIIGGANAV